MLLVSARGSRGSQVSTPAATVFVVLRASLTRENTDATVARMGRGQISLCVTLWLPCLSCGASATLETRAPQAQVAPKKPAQKKPYPSDGFIVSVGGRIELRSVSTPEVTVLAEEASGETVYDPELELIWYTHEGRLFVVDLREPGSAPILIASAIPDVSKLQIDREERSVGTEDTCEGPALTLRWNASPSVEAYDGDISETVIDGRPWLQQQMARSARAIGAKRELNGKRLRLPRKVTDCEMPEECAVTAEFGERDLQLVLVLDKGGGDCWNRGCLLRDPHTDRYASPPDRELWGPVEQAKPGACGLYYFNQQKSAFLVGSRLCLAGAACTALDGEALGWLNAGDIVGAVGDPGDDEVEE